MKRRFRRADELEEAPMWKPLTGKEGLGALRRAAALMKDSAAFINAMRLVLSQWPNSCEHNLSWEAQNRIAWLGHAGCFLGVGSPESCTRLGWHTLSPSEQDAANRAAEIVLSEWEATEGENAQGVFGF